MKVWESAVRTFDQHRFNIYIYIFIIKYVALSLD